MSVPAERSPLRFVHASDLHLEQPLAGLTEVPDHLREALREAPLRAARQVFDTTLAESADALLLSGDVLDPVKAGPRAIVFLLEQFGRLRDRGVAVYWAGGRVDPASSWPPSTPLPDNVHVFPIGRVEGHDLMKRGQVAARILGISRADGGTIDTSGFRRDPQGRFTVGVAYMTGDPPGKEGDRVDYMALGGKHRRVTVDTEPGIAHYPGTPQGRKPHDAGPSGCTILQVDDGGGRKLRFAACDTVRWIDESVEVTASVTRDQLLERLKERLDKVRGKNQGHDSLITWTVRGAGPLLAKIGAGALGDELLTELQRYDGRQQPACWSVAIRAEDTTEVGADLLEQETILGDALRALHKLEHDPRASFDLAKLLPPGLDDPALASIAQVGDADQRAALLGRAKRLALSMLSAEA